MANKHLLTKPDPWQIIAITALLVLAALPLLWFLQPQVTAFVVLLLALRLAVLRWPALQPNRWLLALLALAGFANVGAAYHAIAGQEAGTALLLTMMGLKALELQQRRDLWVLLLLLGFLLVVTFLFDSSPLLTAYLVLILVASFALMADLAVLRGSIQQRWRESGRLALSLSAQALPLAVLLFVLFPRLDAPLWSIGLDQQRALSGVSDQLDLGGISELTLSGRTAFHAYFDQPLAQSPDTLYWRGPVLWRTTGRRWEPAADDLESAAELEPLSDPIDYYIIMEPTAQTWVFALDAPITAPSQTKLTADFRIVADEKINEVKRYDLRSVLSYRTHGLTDAERALALDVPEQAITRRLRALVTGWQAENADPAALVDRALRHFNQEPFYYTLFPPLLRSNQPVDEFLFESRQGYCEHYASSFALLMRLAGVPARLVVGYMGAEYNPVGGHYIVRQSDAHAWAEVWLDERGWVRVDPTAAIAPERVDTDAGLANLGDNAPIRFRVDADGRTARLARQLRLLIDAADAGWKNWVVGFSSHRQQRLLEWLGLGEWREYGLVAALFSGATVLLLLLNAWLAHSRQHPDPLVRSYEQLCRKLAHAGVVRHPAEGPQDYLRRAARVRPQLAAELEHLLALYLPLRFGAVDDETAYQQFRQAVNGLVVPRRDTALRS